MYCASLLYKNFPSGFQKKDRVRTFKFDFFIFRILLCVFLQVPSNLQKKTMKQLNLFRGGKDKKPESNKFQPHKLLVDTNFQTNNYHFRVRGRRYLCTWVGNERGKDGQEILPLGVYRQFGGVPRGVDGVMPIPQQRERERTTAQAKKTFMVTTSSFVISPPLTKCALCFLQPAQKVNKTAYRSRAKVDSSGRTASENTGGHKPIKTVNGDKNSSSAS